MPILVDATQAGTTGWIIAIAAGVVLVGTTALRIRQVTKGGGDVRARGRAGPGLPAGRRPDRFLRPGRARQGSRPARCLNGMSERMSEPTPNPTPDPTQGETTRNGGRARSAVRPG